MMDFAHIEMGYAIEEKGTTPPLASQIHSAQIVTVDSLKEYRGLREWPMEGDAVVTHAFDLPIYVYSADCIPVLFYTKEPDGPIAAVHSGWRGTLKGIVPKTLEALDPEKWEVHAWVGPCIRSCHFEVKEDFINTFTAANIEILPFIEEREGSLFCHLEKLVLKQLSSLPPERIHTSDLRCTYCTSPQLPSFRRDGSTQRQIRSWIRKQKLFVQ